jgi:hypothetical protein
MDVTARHLDGGMPQKSSQRQHVDASLCGSGSVRVPQIIQTKMLLNASALYRRVMGFSNALDSAIRLFRPPRPSR